MDNFCIERGTLLDEPSTVTLLNPERHSVHWYAFPFLPCIKLTFHFCCSLIDVPPCYNSNFEILAPPSNGETLYNRAFQFTDDGKAGLIGLASAVGDPDPSDSPFRCTQCTGTMGSLGRGFRAMVHGIVTADAEVDGTPATVHIVDAQATHESQGSTFCTGSFPAEQNLSFGPPVVTVEPTTSPVKPTSSPSTAYPTMAPINPTSPPSTAPPTFAPSTSTPTSTPTMIPTNDPTSEPPTHSPSIFPPTMAPDQPTNHPSSMAPTNTSVDLTYHPSSGLPTIAPAAEPVPLTDGPSTAPTTAPVETSGRPSTNLPSTTFSAPSPVTQPTDQPSTSTPTTAPVAPTIRQSSNLPSIAVLALTPADQPTGQPVLNTPNATSLDPANHTDAPSTPLVPTSGPTNQPSTRQPTSNSHSPIASPEQPTVVSSEESSSDMVSVAPVAVASVPTLPSPVIASTARPLPTEFPVVGATSGIQQYIGAGSMVMIGLISSLTSGLLY